MRIDPDQVQPDAHIWKRAKRWILDRTVAIFIRMPDGNPKQWGSGVLLQIDEAVFVASASHVMTIVHENAEILIGSMKVETRGLVSIGRSPVTRTVDQEKLDLALVRLPQTAIDALSLVKQFVKLSELDLGRSTPQGRYYVAGYPIQLTQTDHSAKRITVGTYTHTTHLADSDNAHPAISIAVSHRKESITRSEDGEPASVPALQGISGCGIWRLWTNADADQLAEWDETWIRLAGVEHSLAGEVILGTMAFRLLEMVVRTQPVEITLSHDGASFRVP